jgi:hypothetical protein
VVHKELRKKHEEAGGVIWKLLPAGVGGRDLMSQHPQLRNSRLTGFEGLSESELSDSMGLTPYLETLRET